MKNSMEPTLSFHDKAWYEILIVHQGLKQLSKHVTKNYKSLKYFVLDFAFVDNIFCVTVETLHVIVTRRFIPSQERTTTCKIWFSFFILFNLSLLPPSPPSCRKTDLNMDFGIWIRAGGFHRHSLTTENNHTQTEPAPQIWNSSEINKHMNTCFRLI